MSKTSESEEAPKRQRRVHAKTRTGCKTCKIRKVKCDEAKPHCNRCTSTGRKCDGYPSAQPIQYFRPRSASPSSSSLIIPPNVFDSSIPGSESEKRSFQYFVTNTAAELSGYFNEEFWKGFVLRACWEKDNAALRHAVVGIAALHEVFEQSENRDEGVINDTFAVGQYSKAMGHLREVIATTKPSDSPIPALMSSVLFVCFDSLRGSFASAVVHLQSGLRILKDVRAQIRAQKSSNSRRQGKGISREEEFIVEKYIAPLFVRLSVQAILYVDTRPWAERLAISKVMAEAKTVGHDDTKEMDQEDCDGMFEEIKWKFDTLEEAREMLNFTAEGLFRMTWICNGDLPLSAQSPQTTSLYNNYTKALGMWTDSFNSFMSRNTAGMSTIQVRGATLVKIHHCILQVLLQVVPDLEDPRPVSEAMNAATTFNKPNIIELFKTTVNLCRLFITAVEQDALKTPGSVKVGKNGKTFSPDLGVVGPLYYVGTKCPIPSIRNEALSLLYRWKGKEGMWDATAGGRLVEEFWKVEHQFGSRGYEIVEAEEGDDLLHITVPLSEHFNAYVHPSGQPADQTTRGRVMLVVGEGGQMEWRIRMNSGNRITIPHDARPAEDRDVTMRSADSQFVPVGSESPSFAESGFGDLPFDSDVFDRVVASFPWDLFDPLTLPPPPVDVTTISDGMFPSNSEYDVGENHPELFANGVDQWLNQLEQQLQGDSSMLGFDLCFGGGGLDSWQATTPQSFSTQSINDSDGWQGSWEGNSSC